MGIHRLVKKNAFTLAEVLITLGIIGVVAALTIPTLINNVQNAQFKTAWKKSYSNIMNAANSIASDNNDSFWDSNICPSTTSYQDNEVAVRNKFCNYLSCVDTYGINNSSNQVAVLSDGTILTFWISTNGTFGWINVDVNGNKPPNVFGKDIFGLVRGDSANQYWRAERAGDGGGITPACDPSATIPGLACSSEYLMNK